VEERYRSDPLGQKHLPLRAAFICGEEALDRYLRERARKEMEQRVAAVWVLYDGEENRLAGFYTLSAMVVERGELPATFTHRLAQYDVYPATLIGRLAVDQRYHGQRIGGRLLLDALFRALAASRQVASLVVVTDAKNEDVRGFYQHYGFQLLPTEQYKRRLFLPMKTVEALFAERAGEPPRAE
jgi:GNAT superfamily N-acetyltransferase